MPADRGIRVTECANSHLSSITSPCTNHRLNLLWIVGISTVEAEGFPIGFNEVELGRLIVVESDNLGAAFAIPAFIDFPE